MQIFFPILFFLLYLYVLSYVCTCMDINSFLNGYLVCFNFIRHIGCRNKAVITFHLNLKGFLFLIICKMIDMLNLEDQGYKWDNCRMTWNCHKKIWPTCKSFFFICLPRGILFLWLLNDNSYFINDHWVISIKARLSYIYMISFSKRDDLR